MLTVVVLPPEQDEPVIPPLPLDELLELLDEDDDELELLLEDELLELEDELELPVVLE